MSHHAVDLGAIRGDWDFHARYATNAMEQTLKRAVKVWRTLKARSPVSGQVPMHGELMEEFLEACRQTRTLTDDILLLQETRPALRGKGAVKRSGKKKGRTHK